MPAPPLVPGQNGRVTDESSRRSQMVAGIFDRVAQQYDRVGVSWFTPIAARLVGELRPRPGERALDIGCGRGAALLPVAEAVAPGGRVTGIDLAPGMIEALRSDVEARGVPGVELQLMDAGDPAFPAASFDLLSASLVLFFLPDPAAALARWRALLVPGGRLGISTFGQQDERWRAVDDVFTPYLSPQMLDARTSGRAGPFASDEGVETLFRVAGLDEVRTTFADVSVVFDDVAQWQDWTWSHGQRAMWEAVPADHRDAVLAEARPRLEAARDDAGQIRLTQQVRYTLGRRPA
jgi:ubiquinone/menaquinone biosynthesis C-methylase UbiE